MFIRHNYLLLPVTSKAKIWTPTKKSPIQVVDGFLWNPFKESFEDVRGATYEEIVAILQISQLHGFNSVKAFAPITTTFNAGLTVYTIPTGATTGVFEIYSGGGAGGRATNGGGGGASGAYAKTTVTVTAGGSHTFDIAASVAGRNTNGVGTTGNSTTITGNPYGQITLTGGTGGGATGGAGGTPGGYLSLGTPDQNIQGNDGGASGGANNEGLGAGGVGPLAALGGSNVEGQRDGFVPGAGGAGSTSTTSGAGAAGRGILALT